MTDLSNSKCSFCNSKSFGKNCPFSPYKKTHCHMDLAGSRCIWCGSAQIHGPNCPLSPSKYHGSSSNAFTSMISESFFLGYLINLLETPFINTDAYKLGIINERGEKIKTPSTEEELSAYSPINKYFFNMKKLLGERLEILNQSVNLESSIESSKTEKSIEKYEAELQFSNEMDIVKKRLFESINEGLNSNLTLADIIHIIIEKMSKNE